MGRNQRCTDMYIFVHSSKLSTVNNSTLCRVLRLSVQVPTDIYVHRVPRLSSRDAGLSPDLYAYLAGLQAYLSEQQACLPELQAYLAGLQAYFTQLQAHISC
jgi:hypothetical protein